MLQEQSTGNARRDEVRARYAEAARRVTAASTEQAGGCCGPAAGATVLATIDANSDCCGGGS